MLWCVAWVGASATRTLAGSARLPCAVQAGWVGGSMLLLLCLLSCGWLLLLPGWVLLPVVSCKCSRLPASRGPVGAVSVHSIVKP
eukprot:1579497-Amphidinium_carterae.1